MSFFPSGTVYGTLLNFRGELAALADQMNQPPYRAPPQAPVLYIKTANTWSVHGAAILLPPQVVEAEVGASVGMVIGEQGQVAGYVVMNDLSVPHSSFFRPPVKFKNLDGFLGLGEQLRPAATAVDPSAFTLQVHINGELRQSVDFSQLVRPAARLLADVRAFMSLHPGDVLMLGCDSGRPLARAGDHITITGPGFAAASHTLRREAA